MNALRIALVASLFALSACGIDQAEVGADGELLDVGTDDLSTTGRFETFKGKDGQTYFHLIAGNGQKVLSSEGYSSASAAAAGIKSVQANGATESRYLMREATDGSSYFVLVAANGEIIGVSQMYSTASNATRGVTAVVSVVKATVSTVAAAPAAKFEVFKGLDSKYYFHARAGNGEIVLQSQAYTTKASAQNGVASVKTNGADLKRYTVLAAADGKFYFTLKAANGQVIARGQTYATRSNADRGVAGCVSLLTVELRDASAVAAQ